MATPVTFLEHLEELRRRLFKIAIGIIIGMLISFAFSVTSVDVGPYRIPILIPDPDHNLASQLINRIVEDQKPAGVSLGQFSPAQAFFAQIYMSIFLGIIIAMPVIVHQITGFLNPALYPHEKRMILRIVLPGSLLFLGGAVFAYYTITRVALTFLYGFGTIIFPGIFQVITIDDLLNYVIMFSIGTGLAFQLPIFMWVLTKLGVIQASYWRRNFRIAVVVILIFSAMLTPDGTGITMLLLAAPLMVLYAAGYLICRRVQT